MKPHFNKTKIIATVGPACNKKDQLKALVMEGVDVFRLNFSHGTHEEHAQVIKFVRELNEENGWNIALLQDLQGPKIRTREIENNGVNLVAGSKVVLSTEKVIGTAERVTHTYVEMAQDVKVGDRILLDDGKLELQVREISGEEVITEVIYGGTLKSKKGINLPNTNVSIPALTEKDREDLIFGLSYETEWVALSFVRTAEEIKELRKIIQDAGKLTKIVAKIEKPEALLNIDAIIEATDAVMVARGDLGVEINAEEVPIWQKIMVKKCNELAKPVIIATQMLESMITSPRPTRAETNDIANAVIDGTDVVMLSAETASGMYPVLAVRSMNDTITYVETKMDVYHRFYDRPRRNENFYSNCVILSACELAKDVEAKAIIGSSSSGHSAMRISSHRPKANIFIFTDNRFLVNALSLVWGVRTFYLDKLPTTDDLIDEMEKVLTIEDLLHSGDLVVSTASMPVGYKQRTNMLKLSVVK
ncbi:MAG: pyruvate kinase [Verrucomicrobia bacterium]|nr:pyruvate kinase [Cytophagales bacterium]